MEILIQIFAYIICGILGFLVGRKWTMFLFANMSQDYPPLKQAFDDFNIHINQKWREKENGINKKDIE